MGFDPYMSADGPQTSSASDDAKAVNNITTHLFDPARPRYPNPEYLPHLSTLFFEHLACHFPFLDRVDVVRRAEEGSLPAILANCIAALAVRFSDKEELLVGPRQSAGEAFCAMAKVDSSPPTNLSRGDSLTSSTLALASYCTYAFVAFHGGFTGPGIDRLVRIWEWTGQRSVSVSFMIIQEMNPFRTLSTLS